MLPLNRVLDFSKCLFNQKNNQSQPKLNLRNNQRIWNEGQLQHSV